MLAPRLVPPLVGPDFIRVGVRLRRPVTDEVRLTAKLEDIQFLCAKHGSHDVECRANAFERHLLEVERRAGHSLGQPLPSVHNHPATESQRTAPRRSAVERCGMRTYIIAMPETNQAMTSVAKRTPIHRWV